MPGVITGVTLWGRQRSTHTACRVTLEKGEVPSITTLSMPTGWDVSTSQPANRHADWILIFTGLLSLQGFLTALGTDCQPLPRSVRPSLHLTQTPRVPGPRQLFEGCTSGADAEVYDSPPCLEQTTSSNFSAPSGSATLRNIAEKGEASSLPPRNMNSVESIAQLCDDQFVPGMQCASGIWYPAGSLTPRWVIHSPARLMVTQATS